MLAPQPINNSALCFIIEKCWQKLCGNDDCVRSDTKLTLGAVDTHVSMISRIILNSMVTAGHCTLESWLADWVFHIFVVKNVAFCLKMWLRGWNETYQKLSILILDRSLVKLDFNFQLYSVFERFFQFSPRGHFKRKYRQNLASSGGNILVSFETQIYYGDFDVWHGNIHQFEAGLTKQKRLSKEDKEANDLCKTTYWSKNILLFSKQNILVVQTVCLLL